MNDSSKCVAGCRDIFWHVKHKQFAYTKKNDIYNDNKSEPLCVQITFGVPSTSKGASGHFISDVNSRIISENNQ